MSCWGKGFRGKHRKRAQNSGTEELFDESDSYDYADEPFDDTWFYSNPENFDPVSLADLPDVPDLAETFKVHSIFTSTGGVTVVGHYELAVRGIKEIEFILRHYEELASVSGLGKKMNLAIRKKSFRIKQSDQLIHHIFLAMGARNTLLHSFIFSFQFNTCFPIFKKT